TFAVEYRQQPGAHRRARLASAVDHARERTVVPDGAHVRGHPVEADRVRVPSPPVLLEGDVTAVDDRFGERDGVAKGVGYAEAGCGVEVQAGISDEGPPGSDRLLDEEAQPGEADRWRHLPRSFGHRPRQRAGSQIGIERRVRIPAP